MTGITGVGNSLSFRVIPDMCGDIPEDCLEREVDPFFVNNFSEPDFCFHKRGKWQIVYQCRNCSGLR